MKKFKKKLISFLILTAIFSVSIFATNNIEEIKNRGELIVATSADQPPFEFKEGNEIVGIDIDVAKKISDSLNVKLKIKNITFDGLISELINGNCDFVISAMGMSNERQKSVDFSVPYYAAKHVIIVPKNGEIFSSDNLNNKKIGVQVGTSDYLYCIENFDSKLVTPYKTPTDAVLNLINGKIDAVVVDELPANEITGIYKDEVKILEASLYDEGYRIAVKKGKEEFLNYINSVITELKSSGEIEKIKEYYLSAEKNQSSSFLDEIYNNLIYKDRYKMIFKGLLVTFQITIVALTIGIVIGLAVSLLKISKSKRIIIKILKQIANLYVAVIRGTPLLVQVFVISYIVLASSGLNSLVIAIIAFGINSGAYVSEIMRSGFQSVSSEQYEAGRSLGLSSAQTMVKIVFPQALKNVIPTLANEFSNLIKETSIVSIIGIADLSRVGDEIRSQTYQPVVPLLTVALIYFVIVTGISWIFSRVEKRMNKNDNH